MTNSPISTWTGPVRSRRSREMVPAAAGLTFLLLAGWFAAWRGPMPLESLLRALGRIDHWDQARTLASDPASLRKYYGLSLAVGLGLAGFLTLAATAWRRLSEEARSRAWRAAATAACSCAVLLYIAKMQYEGEWAPIDVLLANPGALPLFGHRLLFVWVAKSFRAVAPSLSPLSCYYGSQAVAATLALHALGRWSALHVGESLSWLGQVLSVVLISTCFSYRFGMRWD